MITNINDDISKMFFCGDLDEPFTITQNGVIIEGLTGIFKMSNENTDLQGVSIPSSNKKTLQISSAQLAAKQITLNTSDIITLRNQNYMMIVSPNDNLNGTLTVEIGEA